MAKQIMSIRLDPEVIVKIQAMEKGLNISFSEAVRRLVSKGLLKDIQQANGDISEVLRDVE